MSIYSQTNGFDKIPSESVYVHTNTKLLVTGETLYYNLYNFNTATNTASDISKIAYVMLVSNSKKVVFKHKLKLKKGQANGDFFIPTSIKTGNYKLIAYTKWMHNNTEKPFFDTDIYILNPFLKNEKPSKIKKRVTDSIVLKSKEENFNFIQKTKTRNKVVIHVNEIFKEPIKENFTISIRKTDDVRIIKNKKGKKIVKKDTSFYLPEIRGEIFSGTVISKTNNKAVENIIVALSISNNKIYRNVKTNKKGQFIFSINENYLEGKLIIQILDTNKEEYKIVLDNYIFEYLDELKFSTVYLHPNIKKWLLQKSINHQIESSYIDSKKDSLEQRILSIPFYGSPSFTYNLDDYKRFNSIKETFVEVIQGASIRKRKGKKKIAVFSANSKLNKVMSGLEPLILIDGILVPNQEDFIHYDVHKIKTMQFINEVYFYGHKLYEFVLDVETYKGDYFPHTSSVFSKNIKSMQRHKMYYNPKYSTTNKLNRIPDFRTQLLWHTNLTENTKEIQFYTSDIKGVYEIILEGFTNKKEPIKAIKYLLVE